AMHDAVDEAMAGGALGFSTSRSPTHVTPDDTPVASRIGGWDEIDRLVAPMTELNAGIFQLAPDVTSGASQEAFFEQVRRIALESGRPIMFGTIASRQGKDPKPWQFHTKYLDETVAMGGRMYGQATTRSINALFSLKSNLPFDLLPTWKEVRALPLEEQKRRLADPETRGKLIAEEAQMKPRGFEFQGGGAATTNPLRPDYTNLIVMQGVDWDDPTVDDLARSANKNPVETMIDLMLANEDQIFIQPLVNENPEDVLGLLKHPRTLATFSDSGAHVCQEMGSSLPTHLLNYWVRLRQEFTLEEGIRMLTFDNASAWELPDRGLVRAGFAADLVIFDENGIKPAMPTVAADLPGGAKRLIQKAEGIAATVVNGAVTFVNGESTGNYPGQLIKGRLAS
ncbi:MAG: amidohydrolase family protein, partial [Rhodospirillaceae bacterium]|nr:amidohydrolase family protein [Rhodospirillaceae bacterium]